MITGTNVTLLVGGSIAAYKAAELTRELVKKGARVHVVMSDSATKFITPLTMQSLSGNLVTTDLFDEVRESRINHIWLADHADIVLVAPATADIIARVAAGMANDALTTVLLATKAPIVFAPAMNVNMWQNPITQRNVQTLRDLGMYFVEPGEGELACGWFGPGRFAELDDILHMISFVRAAKDLNGSNVVIAAGPTQEPLDPVRFISNRSSGRLGFALARVACWRGAKVSLVSGPTALEPPPGVDFYPVGTAVEMRDKVIELASRKIESADGRGVQFVFMPTAVTDHMPKSFSKTKLKQETRGNLALELVPTPDILQELGDRREQIAKSSGRSVKLVGFMAETADEDELLAGARDKLEKKNADLMVINAFDPTFEESAIRVWVVDRAGRQEEIASAEETLTASKIVSAALRV